MYALLKGSCKATQIEQHNCVIKDLSKQDDNYLIKQSLMINSHDVEQVLIVHYTEDNNTQHTLAAVKRVVFMNGRVFGVAYVLRQISFIFFLQMTNIFFQKGIVYLEWKLVENVLTSECGTQINWFRSERVHESFDSDRSRFMNLLIQIGTSSWI